MSGRPDSDPDPRAPEDEVARRLADERRRPTAAFRGALNRRLAAEDPGYGPRPADLWTAVGRFAFAAAILLALGVLQAAGVL